MGSTGQPSIATFIGKATIQDLTNPLSPISIDGGASLQVTMTDNGDPASWSCPDTIGITASNKNGALEFSSHWTGTQTQEQQLVNPYGGGNVSVH